MIQYARSSYHIIMCIHLLLYCVYTCKKRTQSEFLLLVAGISTDISRFSLWFYVPVWPVNSYGYVEMVSSNHTVLVLVMLYNMWRLNNVYCLVPQLIF